MRGSITFKFGEELNDCGVHIDEQGQVNSGDLEVVVALINQEFLLKRLIEAGEIKLTTADPTGRAQLWAAWSN